MKIILSFLFVILNLIGFGQAKNCHSVNVPGKPCEVQVISENNDTIICLIENDCYYIKYNLNKDATWIIYSKDTSKILEIISFCDGKQTKTHTQYYDNGKLKCQSKYENGELIGPYISFFEGGEIEWAGIYIEGHFIGSIYKYWDNGKVAEIRIQTESSYYGKYNTYYDPSGNSMSETEFKQMWECN